MNLKAINVAIQGLPAEQRGGVSDGYHTNSELYHHRCLLFLALAKKLENQAWKFRKNADGSEWKGWFGLGIFPEPGRQITYHLPEKHWNVVQCKEYDRNPHYDGHTGEDVMRRLEVLVMSL